VASWECEGSSIWNGVGVKNKKVNGNTEKEVEFFSARSQDWEPLLNGDKSNEVKNCDKMRILRLCQKAYPDKDITNILRIKDSTRVFSFKCIGK